MTDQTCGMPEECICGGCHLDLSPPDEPEQVSVSKDDLENLVYYADIVASILKQNGFPGKAEALENRYMKFSHLLELTMDNNLPEFNDLSKRLAEFYQVDDYHKLVEAQSHHIKKLQDKLQKLQKPFDFSPSRVR